MAIGLKFSDGLRREIHWTDGIVTVLDSGEGYTEVDNDLGNAILALSLPNIEQEAE